jgi:hypothetical protein
VGIEIQELGLVDCVVLCEEILGFSIACIRIDPFFFERV